MIEEGSKERGGEERAFLRSARRGARRGPCVYPYHPYHPSKWCCSREVPQSQRMPYISCLIRCGDGGWLLNILSITSHGEIFGGSLE